VVPIYYNAVYYLEAVFTNSIRFIGAFCGMLTDSACSTLVWFGVLVARWKVRV